MRHGVSYHDMLCSVATSEFHTAHGPGPPPIWSSPSAVSPRLSFPSVTPPQMVHSTHGSYRSDIHGHPREY